MLPVWVGIGLFSAGVLLSGFFSRYAKIVWAGMSAEYESLPILIALPFALKKIGISWYDASLQELPCKC